MEIFQISGVQKLLILTRFSFSRRIQTPPILSSGGLMDDEKIWDLPGKNGGRDDSANPEKLKSVRTMEVEQRCIIKFLHLKGLTLGDVVVELSTLYGENASPWPSIKYWLHQLKLGRTDLKTQHVGGRPYLDEPDAEIPSVLRISPFSSVRTIADSLGIPGSTVFCTSSKRLGSTMTSSVGFRTC
jgi:hypothetical protein